MKDLKTSGPKFAVAKAMKKHEDEYKANVRRNRIRMKYGNIRSCTSMPVEENRPVPIGAAQPFFRGGTAPLQHPRPRPQPVGLGPLPPPPPPPPPPPARKKFDLPPAPKKKPSTKPPSSSAASSSSGWWEKAEEWASSSSWQKKDEEWHTPKQNDTWLENDWQTKGDKTHEWASSSSWQKKR